MSDLPALATLDTGLAERAADPGEFVIAACERAKAWLGELLADGSIEQIVEVKSQAEAIRVYTVQKNLGKDAQLAAAEVVRRAERGIGLAIRRGQEEGTIIKHGTVGGGGRGADKALASRKLGYQGLDRPTDYVSQNELSGNRAGIYAMTDGVSDEQFDAAVEEARAEGNLSRANVVRRAKGEPAPMKSEYHHKRRRIDHARILNETIYTLDGLMSGLRLIDLSAIDPEARAVWADRLHDAAAPVNRFIREVRRGA